jgi:hypothetical protein
MADSLLKYFYGSIEDIQVRGGGERVDDEANSAGEEKSKKIFGGVQPRLFVQTTIVSPGFIQNFRGNLTLYHLNVLLNGIHLKKSVGNSPGSP